MLASIQAWTSMTSFGLLMLSFRSEPFNACRSAMVWLRTDGLQLKS